MRIADVAILTTATVLTAAPVRAQTYDPNYPVCLQTYGIDGATSIAATPRWHSAPSRHRAVPPSASSIHILRPLERRRDDIIAASTRCRKWNVFERGILDEHPDANALLPIPR
jgi:hypothetical protein